MPMRTAIWPRDVLADPRPIERGPNQLRCFLICPFTPVHDDLTKLVEDACGSVSTNLHCTLECLRADRIAGSGVIHAELWHELQTADVIIADITGANGNVLLELGVAAAIRHKEHVIVLTEQGQEQKFLFDIGPVRHILYERTYAGLRKLLGNLQVALLLALTTAPTEPDLHVNLPDHLAADFKDSGDVDWLIGPSLTHRRRTPAGLEYGSLFVYRNSWLRVLEPYANLELTAIVRFAQLRDQPAWIGIGVRSQNCLANWSNLIYVRDDGTVIITIIENDLGGYHDDPIGKLPDFSADRDVTFHIRIDGTSFTRSVDSVSCTHRLTDLPHVFPTGMILLQTYNSRALIKTFELQRLSH